MIPEYGHFALITAFFISITLAIVPIIGTLIKNITLMRSSFVLAILMFIAITTSLVCLAYAFWVDDFTVVYVANNSNLELPQHYKISALWSAHEGSLLLWGWLLALWTFAVVLFSRKLPLEIISRVLAVLGMIACGFLAFMLFTSNPFLRHLPFSPPDGNDLNPLLQDFGLIIHPPTLYLGYVGLSVSFAFAIAALLSGKFDAEWVRWTRPWTLAAWIFLTLGIALGSWWAYYELGWGGWWFWDPVENASFMPWLTATALLHSLAVTEKRGSLKSWTLLLAIFAFSLSLLGTFLVRSGVLTSVHAFASDPDRGYFILAFLGTVVGGSLLLYAIRAPELTKGLTAELPTAQSTDASFSVVSRETALLFNNMMLVVIMLVVLIGTLYPLISDALNLGKVSVGPPYFNFFFVPAVAILLLLMPVGMMLKWKKDNLTTLKPVLIYAAAISISSGIAFCFLYSSHIYWQGGLAVTATSWAGLLIAYDVKHQFRHAESARYGLAKLSRSYIGMALAHFGFVLAVAGAALTSIYSEELDARMVLGEKITLAQREFVLHGVRAVQGENYIASVGDVSVYKNSIEVAHLNPEKRVYNSDRGNRMTEAGIKSGFFADIYVSLGEPLHKDADNNPILNGDWAMRLHYKPFVRWIWLGAIVMSLGAMFSIADRRYRVKRTS